MTIKRNCVRYRETDTVRKRAREDQRMSMRDLEVLSFIDPITTTSTGDSECVRV